MNRINENTTKQKILECAAHLFAEKGFAETTVRELAEAADLTVGTLYHYFPSKAAILEHMLEEYSIDNTDVFKDKNISQILRENPTTDGVLTCLQLSFPPHKAEYYLKILCVMFQEQLRNPVVRRYMSEDFILRSEQNIRAIIDILKELRALDPEMDPDYWMVAGSSLFYAFAARLMLGIGDNNPDCAIKSMTEMMRYTFDLLFEKFGTAANRPDVL